jgi:erythromycin esterase
VVYNPENERMDNYVPTVLGQRYDAFLYLDRTHAVHPLHMPVHPARDLPDTFPSGV